MGYSSPKSTFTGGGIERSTLVADAYPCLTELALVFARAKMAGERGTAHAARTEGAG